MFSFVRFRLELYITKGMEELLIVFIFAYLYTQSNIFTVFTKSHNVRVRASLGGTKKSKCRTLLVYYCPDSLISFSCFFFKVLSFL